jgi:CheY-like chemotaxis protein
MAADATLKRQPDGAQAPGPSAAGETILFVEDEVRQLSLMHKFLRSKGYRVLGARDGVEAVELYSRHKEEIAVVVLDIGLPKLNGWDVFLTMRKESPQAKVILATGYVSTEIEAAIARGELSGLILKPYQLDDVLAKIAQAIRSPAPRMPAGPKPAGDRPLAGVGGE